MKLWLSSLMLTVLTTGAISLVCCRVLCQNNKELLNIYVLYFFGWMLHFTDLLDPSTTSQQHSNGTREEKNKQPVIIDNPKGPNALDICKNANGLHSLAVPHCPLQWCSRGIAVFLGHAIFRRKLWVLRSRGGHATFCRSAPGF